MMKSGFHFTITYFWIQMVDYYNSSVQAKDFDHLVEQAASLKDEKLYLQYYKEATIFSKNAEKEMVLPDVKQLPTLLKNK